MLPEGGGQFISNTHKVRNLARLQTEKIEVENFNFQIKTTVPYSHLARRFITCNLSDIYWSFINHKNMASITINMEIITKRVQNTAKNCTILEVTCVTGPMGPIEVATHTRSEILQHAQGQKHCTLWASFSARKRPQIQKISPLLLLKLFEVKKQKWSYFLDLRLFSCRKRSSKLCKIYDLVCVAVIIGCKISDLSRKIFRVDFSLVVNNLWSKPIVFMKIYLFLY